LGIKGHEYFCEIDSEYITDKFNLTGLHAEVEKIPQVVDFITDQADVSHLSDEQRDLIEANSRMLYGLVHARFIITPRGLQRMMEKYKTADFGYCTRVFCQLQHLLPVGLSDHAGVCSVKLYCPKCEDLYNPKSSRHALIDGAFFGSSFPAMFFQQYPHLAPVHPIERYVPKVFGFHLHDYAKLARWQELQRIKLEKRLNIKDIETKNVANGYAYIDENEEMDLDAEEDKE
jgi:casein kinase II subunit beta